MEWYPQNKKELEKTLKKFLSAKLKIKTEIHGIVVPHAGYEFSGEIAGKAFSLLKKRKTNSVIILGPSHYVGFYGVALLKKIKTPLGEVISKNKDIKEIHGLEKEHSIENQIPFLQKLGFKEFIPIVVGELSNKDIKKIAEWLSEQNSIIVFSTDLSHFLPYELAIKKDKQTIKIIEKLDFKNSEKIDACGKNPLLILMHLCKIKKYKPKLIEYKNSGDITKDKKSVVGYASFYF